MLASQMGRSFLISKCLVLLLWISSCSLAQAGTYYYSSTVVCQQNRTSSDKSGCVNGELDLFDQQLLVRFNQVYSQYGLNDGKSWKEAYEYNRKERSLQTTCRDYCGPRGNPTYCNIYCGGSYRRRSLRSSSPDSEDRSLATSSTASSSSGSDGDDCSQPMTKSLNEAAVAAIKNVVGLTTSKACQSFLNGVVCQAESSRM